MSEVHVIQKKVNWTNKQPIIVTQKPRTSSSETAVGKKRKRRKEAEEDREMIKKLVTEGTAVRNERQKDVLGLLNEGNLYLRDSLINLYPDSVSHDVNDETFKF